jgi:hypothetical protein
VEDKWRNCFTKAQGKFMSFGEEIKEQNSVARRDVETDNFGQ